MGSGFSKMRKQARELQDQLSKMQEDLKNLEVIGSAGNGLVEVTLSGEKVLKKIKINPECVDTTDIEGLQDLIVAAFEDAHKKIEEKSPNLPMGNLPLGF